MAIVKFMPLVTLMVQVAETHIYKCTFLQITIQCYVSLPNNYLSLLKQISDNFHV